MKAESSESQAGVEELNQSQSVGTCFVIGSSLSLLLPTLTIWFSHKRNEAESEENGNVLIGSHSDSVDPMTPLTTPILRFPKVISALTTPITSPTPTPSQAKTSLDKIQVPTNSHEAWATCGRTNKVMGGGIGEFCFLYRFPCMNFLGQCMYIF